jgi:hypothetical protein
VIETSQWNHASTGTVSGPAIGEASIQDGRDESSGERQDGQEQEER